jgi:uracil permease
VIISIIIKFSGTGWVEKVLPPVVIGPVVAVIGLSLSGTAISMAFQNSTGSFCWQALLVAAITLAVIFLAMFSRNSFISSISILIGLVSGYLITVILATALPATFGSLFVPPKFGHVFDWPVIINPFSVSPGTGVIVAVSFVITSFATICEHIGHTIVTGDIIGRDVVKDPGLHRTILGDGIATGLAGIFGSVANTTYGESLGVMATTKVYSVFVFVFAALLAIILSLIAPFGALIKALPNAVLGGACILLYGTIAANGLKQMIMNRINLDSNRNLIIVSLIFIIGVGGAVIPVEFNDKALDLLSPIALSAIVGIVLNLILPREKAAGQVAEEGVH